MLTYEPSPEGPFGIIPGFVPLVAAALLIFVNGRYLRQWLTIRWRRWLTAHYQQEWLTGRAYYQMQLQAETLGNDNPDQRISEDIRDFVENGLVLGFGFITNIVSLVSFLTVLWALSFPLTVFGIHIPAYLVWVAILYSIVGTILAQFIGRPLVSLNYIRQRLEADFRYALVRLRENSEGVALYSGEADEGRILTGRFGSIVAKLPQHHVTQPAGERLHLFLRPGCRCVPLLCRRTAVFLQADHVWHADPGCRRVLRGAGAPRHGSWTTTWSWPIGPPPSNVSLSLATAWMPCARTPARSPSSRQRGRIS